MIKPPRPMSFDYNRLLAHFPFAITETTNDSLLFLIEQFRNMPKHPSIMNPHTGLPVFALTFVTLSHFEFAMNFLCSLSYIKFNPKSLIFLTTERECYTRLKNYSFPIYFLDITGCKYNFNAFLKIRLIFLTIFLHLKYECLFFDMDIEFFDNIDELLFFPRVFDVSFYCEFGAIEITHDFPPSIINGGFIRLFPTENAINFMYTWMKANLRTNRFNEQDLLQKTMKNRNLVSCKWFEPDSTQITIKNAYWNCHFHNKTDFVIHYFVEKRMIMACDFFIFRKDISKLKKKRSVPSALHMTCFSGSKAKLDFLRKTGLLFYDRERNKCIAEKAKQRWVDIFNNSASLYEKTDLPNLTLTTNDYVVNEEVLHYITQ